MSANYVYNRGMYYFEVMVGSNSYHGSEALTYSFDEKIVAGTIVSVPLRKSRVSGIVIKITSKPSFQVKPIIAVQTTKPLPASTTKLASWLGTYYPSPSGAVVSQFIPGNLLQNLTVPPPLKRKTRTTTALPPLSAQQEQALTTINSSDVRAALVHGDTGTGKTRLYAELALQSLMVDKSVIVLTPEIGLTSQLAANLSHLPAPIVVFHSGLTTAARRNLWLQVLYSNEPLVIVGPRSALFVPLHSIGLIVVDEAHDGAYKQDQSPKYNALRVAAKLAELHNARLIFGTATPLISEYFFLEAKHIPTVRLTENAKGESSPVTTKIVDGNDRSQFSRHPFLSNVLLDEIGSSLAANKQSLVFLNRRGTARIVLCQNADWQALCPNCDLPLTYHSDTHNMRCHTCGYHAPPVLNCPVCGSSDIVFKSIGTKAVAEALTSLFPSATVRRFDTDNKKDERLDLHYQDIRDGNVDIVVGTQMLVKGLDLPNLATVGVVAADSSLYFPDYTAEEQTYQLLTQVVGRVGRGHGGGTVIIQTFNPLSHTIENATTKNWPTFYQQQLRARKEHHFPPYFHLLKLSVKRKSRSAAQQSAAKFRDSLVKNVRGIEVVGPTPAFHEKLGDTYTWQLIVRSKKRSVLVEIAENLPANWTHDIDPANLL